MSTRILNLCFDSGDPLRSARFWAAALLWEVDETEAAVGIVPTDGTPFSFLFRPVPERKLRKNRLHLDLVSESPEHQSEMVDRRNQGAGRGRSLRDIQPAEGRGQDGKNRLHLDIAPPADGDQAAEVERLIAIGARRVDIGQGDVSWIVMTDPEGSEFCLLTPR